jgi:hypothetical protein
MGGVFYGPEGTPYYWQHPFPADVQASVISAANPRGKVTNSDLEQAAMLAQLDVMADTLNTHYATLENLCNNNTAVSRYRKGAVSNHGAVSLL